MREDIFIILECKGLSEANPKPGNHQGENEYKTQMKFSCDESGAMCQIRRRGVDEFPSLVLYGEYFSL